MLHHFFRIVVVRDRQFPERFIALVHPLESRGVSKLLVRGKQLLQQLLQQLVGLAARTG